MGFEVNNTTVVWLDIIF